MSRMKFDRVSTTGGSEKHDMLPDDILMNFAPWIILPLFYEHCLRFT
jgi:hypothetical protein